MQPTNSEAEGYGALPVLSNGPDGGVTSLAEAAQKTSAELGAVNGDFAELWSTFQKMDPTGRPPPKKNAMKLERC